MNLYSINAGHFKLDGGAMFGVVPKSIWQKLNTPDENNMCSWAMRCLLIEDGNRLILIDNGMGNKQDEKFFRHYFLHGDDTLERSLVKHGFNKSDITDIFLTHLHFDHCGGSIEKENETLVPAFKNATYWSNESHWQWATEPNDREKASFLRENILPIKESGQLKFVEHWPDRNKIKPGSVTFNGLLPFVSFSENISVRYVNGHTTDMMLPQINYKGKTIIYMADLLPSIAHIPVPYVMAYDMFPLTTLKEKNHFSQKHNRMIIYFF